MYIYVCINVYIFIFTCIHTSKYMSIFIDRAGHTCDNVAPKRALVPSIQRTAIDIPKRVLYTFNSGTHSKQAYIHPSFPLFSLSSSEQPSSADVGTTCRWLCCMLPGNDPPPRNASPSWAFLHICTFNPLFCFGCCPSIPDSSGS